MKPTFLIIAYFKNKEKSVLYLSFKAPDAAWCCIQGVNKQKEINMDYLRKWEMLPDVTKSFIMNTMKDAGIDIHELLCDSSSNEQKEIIEDNKKLLTIKEVMELTRYSRSTIIRKINDGTLEIKQKKKSKEKVLIFAFSVKKWLQIEESQKESA